VVDGEGPRARGLHAGGETDHIRVEDLVADIGLRFCLAQDFLIEVQSLDHPSRLLAQGHRRRPAPLSSRTTGLGPEYRRKVELDAGGKFRKGKTRCYATWPSARGWEKTDALHHLRRWFDRDLRMR